MTYKAVFQIFTFFFFFVLTKTGVHFFSSQIKENSNLHKSLSMTPDVCLYLRLCLKSEKKTARTVSQQKLS